MQNPSLRTVPPEAGPANEQSGKARGPEAAWQMVRAISGAFTLVVAVILLASHLSTSAIDPLKSPQLATLKQKLRAEPADEAAKQAVRHLDLEVRSHYFRQLSQSRSGVYLLLTGLVLFLVTANRCAKFQRQSPISGQQTNQPDPAQKSFRARLSVATAGVVITLLLLIVGFMNGSALDVAAVAANGVAAAPSDSGSGPDAAADQEMSRNWPRFRGPGGSGVAAVTNVPSEWDARSAKGIAWKTPVPAPGFNSPIIWGNRFFFSGGDATKREVFCYDCDTGKLIWRQPVANVPGASPNTPEVPETTGYAASTMATDGRRVYVIFATGDVAAFTLDGKLVWAKAFGPLKNPYGHASSLLTWRDRLILLLDQGESEEGKSKLYALDGRTGKTVWQTPRKVGSSWATPISFEANGQPQVVALAIPWAISYRLTDGAELWRVECLNGEVTPSPTFAGGLVLVPSPSEKLLAIQPDGQGDVTKSKVTWSTEENVPDVTSPVSNGQLVFTLTTPGLLTCFDGKDGKKLWEHDYEIECHSSPSIAAGHVYLFGQKGTAVIAQAGRQFKEVFRTEMPDVFHASPAFSENTIILRGTTNLWGLKAGSTQAAK